MEVKETLIKLICWQFNIDKKIVTPEASLVKDLDVDSLDQVELIMAMEEEFNIEIPDEEAIEIVTVQDAIDYIENK